MILQVRWFVPAVCAALVCLVDLSSAHAQRPGGRPAPKTRDQVIAEAVNMPNGDITEGVGRQVSEALRQHFRPEFLNRVDETIVFHPLSRGEVRKIAGLQVERVKKQLEAHGGP